MTNAEIYLRVRTDALCASGIHYELRTLISMLDTLYRSNEAGFSISEAIEAIEHLEKYCKITKSELLKLYSEKDVNNA